MREQKDRYEIFLKVCETGSFSKAAEALNYTQSGISQMMATLEEELEVQLFARVNRGVTLTDNGTRLLPYIREMANQKARLRQAAFNINFTHFPGQMHYFLRCSRGVRPKCALNARLK